MFFYFTKAFKILKTTLAICQLARRCINFIPQILNIFFLIAAGLLDSVFVVTFLLEPDIFPLHLLRLLNNLKLYKSNLTQTHANCQHLRLEISYKTEKRTKKYYKTN